MTKIWTRPTFCVRRYVHIYTADMSTEVASRDDGGCDDGISTHTSLTYTLDSGDYAIIVEGFRNSQGSYTLNVTCDAPDLYRGIYRGPIFCGETASGTTSQNSGEVFGVGTPLHNYTFEVTSATRQPITIDACLSEFDTVLTIWNATWQVTDDDSGCGSTASAIPDVYVTVFPRCAHLHTQPLISRCGGPSMLSTY